MGSLTSEQTARLEVENGLRQYDLALSAIRAYLEPDRPFQLRPSLLQQLQAEATRGLVEQPGEFRTTAVKIHERQHIPPPAHLVKSLVQEMCDYVNDNLHEKSPFHLAAFIMWRLNWIHPFIDGNGRTSRMLSYVVLCVTLGYELPGKPTIPDQIKTNKQPYFDALEAADALDSGNVDVSKMEEMIKGMLAEQLLSVISRGDSPRSH